MSEVIEVNFCRERRAEDDLPLRVLERHKEPCKHARTEIREAARIVNCRDCGELLEAVDVLLRIAERPMRLAKTIEALRATVASLSTEIDALKKERAKHKAAVRRQRGGR